MLMDMVGPSSFSILHALNLLLVNGQIIGKEENKFLQSIDAFARLRVED